MVPNVAGRGHSFKGVTAYLMHDKNGAQTAERVAWSRTGNLHTDDIHRAAAFMAWTDQNREAFRPEGASAAGRPATAGNVYHYSLSWAPDEKPTREQQEAAALASLERLGMQGHQFYIVGHNDEPHTHVHIVVNLVDHNTGRIADIHRDHDKLDRWANDYEREHGIKCEARAAKFDALEQGALAYPAPSLDKQRSRADIAQSASRAYESSDSGTSFMAALEAQGLTIAQGSKRGFVVVDERGEVYALARLIDGAKTKDITARLEGVDKASLPLADDLAAQRQQGREEQQDRGQQEGPAHDQTNDQRTTGGIADDYVKLAQDPLQDLRRWMDETDGRGGRPDGVPSKPGTSASDKPLRPLRGEAGEGDAALAEPPPSPTPAAPPPAEESTAPPPEATAPAKTKGARASRGGRRAIEDASEFDRAGRIGEARAYYRIDEQRRAYAEAQEAAGKASGWWAWITGRKRDAEEHAEAMRLNLQNAEGRFAEAIRALDWYKPESVKRQVLERHGVDGAEARQRQEREQAEHEAERHEKETEVLRQAATSPEQAASLKDAVQPKNAQQRDLAAFVKAKAREHDERKAGDKKASVERAAENSRQAEQAASAQRGQQPAQGVQVPAPGPSVGVPPPSPSVGPTPSARERFAAFSVLPKNSPLRAKTQAPDQGAQEQQQEAQKRAQEAERHEADQPPPEAPPSQQDPAQSAQDRRREQFKDFSVGPDQGPDQGQGLER